MYLKTDNNNILRYNKQNDKKQVALNNSPHFTSSFEKIINNKDVTYTQIDKITQAIDGVLGEDKFFSNAIKTAGFDISDNTLTLKDKSFFRGLYETVKYPFVDMPRDIAIWLLKLAKKTPLKESAEKLANSKILKKRIDTVNAQKSFEIVEELLERFCDSAPKNGNNIEKCARMFKTDSAANISTMAKNYDSKYERTLNRMATSIVSADFSRRDFYNISMLQKNDKEEAKKAQKQRYKQEMTRMAINTGLTFLSLGAFEKYVNKNIYANAAVIALSALIGEVGSRILSKTPLLPLTSEQAAKLSHKKEHDDDNDDKESKLKEQEKEESKPQKTLISKNNRQIFAKFSSQDGRFASFDRLEASIEQEKQKQKKKGMTLTKGVALLSIITSAYYLFCEYKKGTYDTQLKKKNLLNNFKDQFDEILHKNNPDLSLNGKNKNVIKGLIEVYHAQLHPKKLNSPFAGLKKAALQKERSTSVFELEKELTELQNSKEGQEIKEILDEYRQELNVLLRKNNTSIESNEPRFLTPGLYNGVTKIFKMAYQLLSLPGALINVFIKNVVYKDINKVCADAIKKLNLHEEKNTKDNYLKDLPALHNIFQKYKNSPDQYAKVVDEIRKNTRSCTNKMETGELANISRTMVTLITSYFFVNDYRNKVLIESAGKDVKKAREEKNDRIMHKLSNFIINGALMNVFNSVFKTPLNKSLLAATAIAAATEMTNETLVRKSICQPVFRMDSKEDIIEYEEKQLNKKGLMGAWTRTFMKITGKKSLTQKAQIDTSKDKK